MATVTGLPTDRSAARAGVPVIRRPGLSAVAVLAACNPFGLPATRALENGVAGMLTSAKSFEIAGTYTSAGTAWTIDLQVTRPSSRHVVVSSATEKVEAIIVGPQAYFRGQEFLAIADKENPVTAVVVLIEPVALEECGGGRGRRRDRASKDLAEQPELSREKPPHPALVGMRLHCL